MNIFYIDHDPVQAARWMVDKHVVKMILESAQLLSTAHRVLDGQEIVGSSKTGRKRKEWVLPDARNHQIYAATHINHPSAVWCRQSVPNYLWLVEHLYALLDEYTYRYEKRHKCAEIAYSLQSPHLNLKNQDFTTMPSAMADEYKISEDPIINYRNYYKKGKATMHSWKKREQPEWITQ
jgi:extradiol dioxygenase family protein